MNLTIANIYESSLYLGIKIIQYLIIYKFIKFTMFIYNIFLEENK